MIVVRQYGKKCSPLSTLKTDCHTQLSTVTYLLPTRNLIKDGQAKAKTKPKRKRDRRQ